MITYQFPSFKLLFNQQTGEVTTFFPDKESCDVASCMVWPNEEDEKHGALLGITAGQHKLAHELVHNCLAIAEGQPYCPIVWNEAHRLPMPEDAKQREEMIMALTYMVFQKPMPYAGWWQFIEAVQERVNPYEVIEAVRELYFSAPVNEVLVKQV